MTKFRAGKPICRRHVHKRAGIYLRKIPFQKKRRDKQQRPSRRLDISESLYLEDDEGWTCPGGTGRAERYRCLLRKRKRPVIAIHHTHAARMRCFSVFGVFTKRLSSPKRHLPCLISLHTFFRPNNIDRIRGEWACLHYPGAHLLLGQHAREIWRTSGKKFVSLRCPIPEIKLMFR